MCQHGRIKDNWTKLRLRRLATLCIQEASPFCEIKAPVLWSQVMGKAHTCSLCLGMQRRLLMKSHCVCQHPQCVKLIATMPLFQYPCLCINKMTSPTPLAGADFGIHFDQQNSASNCVPAAYLNLSRSFQTLDTFPVGPAVTAQA